MTIPDEILISSVVFFTVLIAAIACFFWYLDKKGHSSEDRASIMNSSDWNAVPSTPPMSTVPRIFTVDDFIRSHRRPITQPSIFQTQRRSLGPPSTNDYGELPPSYEEAIRSSSS